MGQAFCYYVWLHVPCWSSKLIARTSRDPLATRAPAERDLVNARPRLSKSSYQICRCSCSAAPRASLRQRSWSWARVRCHARSRTGRRQPSLHAFFVRATPSESYGGARAASSGPGHAAGRAAGDGELHAMGRRLSSRPCIRRAQLGRPRRPASTLRAAAGAVHALMLRAVRGVQRRGGVPLQQAAQLAHPNRARASVLLSHDKRALCRC